MRTESDSEWSRYVRRVIDESFGGSQTDLARALGISTQSVSRWVNHGAAPRYPVLLKLAALTGQSPAELQALAAGIDLAESKRLTAQAVDVARRVRRISPDADLDSVLDQLRQARTDGRITARDYREAVRLITFAAKMQLQEKVAHRSVDTKST